MIRDRKMYVVPTPYALASGLAHHLTLITPDFEEPESLVCVGDLVRVEWEKRLVGYSFDFATNALVPELTDNPNAGRKHRFRAWRLPEQPSEQVFMLDAAKRR
jgi:hypothetical protein